MCYTQSSGSLLLYVAIYAIARCAFVGQLKEGYMYRNVSEYKFSELSKDAQQIVRENLNKKSNFFRQQMLDKSKMICQWGFMISAGSLASIVVLISTPHFYFLFNWIGWFIGSLVLCVTPFAVALYLDVFCFVRCESSKKKVI
jgi:hypothetical protein